MEDAAKADSEFTRLAGQYAEQHNVFDLFRGLMTDIVIAQPSDPLAFIIHKLQTPAIPKIIIMGPPAGGKGTQCAKIVEVLDCVHISTGDLLREAVKQGTPSGKKAQPYMEAGGLVPDEIVVTLVKECVTSEQCVRRGWLLDGFPRTRSQATALQVLGILPDKIIVLDVPDDVIEERVSGRRRDPVTGEVYHLTFKPPTDPQVIARLTQRKDDKGDVIKKRLKTYHRSLKGIVSSYPEAIQHRVNGNCDPETIFAEISDILRVQYATAAPKTFKICLLGPPGAGLTSQAERIAKRYHVVRLTPRDLLRREVAADTPLGRRAAAHVEDHVLPNDLVLEAMLIQCLSKDCLKRGWVMDGYPYDAEAVSALTDDGIIPNRVLLVDVAPPVATARLKDLRTDPMDGQRYRDSDVSDPEVARRLVTRAQHTAPAVDARLAAYLASIGDVLDMYSDVLEAVDGILPEQTVFDHIQAVIDRPLPATTLKAPVAAPSGTRQGARAPPSSAVAAPAPVALELRKQSAITSSCESLLPDELLRVCVVGPPGAGRTTQSRLLSQKYGLVLIMPFDLLADEIERGSALGVKAERYATATRMPDEIVMEVIKNRVHAKDCQEQGWVLDGFPDTQWMAEHLHENGVEANRYIFLDIADSVAEERLLGRCVHPPTMAFYHEKFYPPPANIADEIEHFDEDEEHRIHSRIKQYRNLEGGAHDFHSDLFFHVNADNDIECTFKLVRIGVQTRPHHHVDLRGELHAGLRILVLGPPSSGVMTQAARLADDLGVGLIAPRMALQEHVMKGTELGKKAAPHMNAPEIPDEIVDEAIAFRLQEEDCSRGWVMAGYPDTRHAAAALSKEGIRPHRVVFLEVSDSVCRERSDEQGHAEDRFTARLARYRKNRNDVANFYQKILLPVEGAADVDTVTERVEAALKSTKEQGNHKLLVFGPPAAGASCAATSLADLYGVPVVNPHAILEKEMTAQTRLGKQYQETLSGAPFVPDRLLHAAVQFALSLPMYDGGWILDGYPSSVESLQSLASDGIVPQRTFYLDVSDETAKARNKLNAKSAAEHKKRMAAFTASKEAMLQAAPALVRVNAEGSKEDIVSAMAEALGGLSD